MIYLFLADGFEEIEALTTLDILRRAGCTVQTVGIGGEVITGTHGVKVLADLKSSEVVTNGLEAVVLPGGMPGAKNLEHSSTVRECVLYCAEKKLPIAAICAAPYVLGKWGLLQGKRAVCYPGFEAQLEGAVLAQESVCVDGNIVTGKGAGVALAFALALTGLLRGEKTVNEICESIQCQ